MEPTLTTDNFTIRPSTLLAGLILFFSMVVGHAQNNAALPSRDPTVVLPILSHYAPLDTSKGSVMHELKRILGNFDRNDDAGPVDHAWRMYSYHLNDGTVIIIEFKEHSGPDSLNLTMIIEEHPDGKLKVLYGTWYDFNHTGLK